MINVELREQRAKSIHDAREIIDRADAEKRELSADENAKVDELFAKSDVLENKIKDTERREILTKKEDSLREKISRQHYHQKQEGKDTSYREVLTNWLRGEGRTKMYVRELGKAQSTGGQDAVSWTDFFGGVYDELKYFSPVLDLVDSIDSDNGNTLPIPTFDDTSNMAEIVTESTAAATNADPVIDVVNLGAFRYSSKEILYSTELEQDSSFPLVSKLESALAERFARKWASDITTGGGTTLPYGLVTRAASASVTFAGTNAAPTMTFDKLLDLKYAVDKAYRDRPGAGYMLHETNFVAVRKLKDDNQNYIFQPNLSAAAPGTIDGSPVYINSNMAASGSSAKIVLFGDYKSYLWRRVKAFELHRLTELYIEQGLYGLLAFTRADGTLIRTNAVKYAACPA